MYTPKKYDHLLGLAGFSDQLLQNHFKLYEGYVVNSNKNFELAQNALKVGNTYEYGEIKRRFGWEFNGMRLHEYYFDALNKTAKVLDQKSVLYKKICKDFGSFEKFNDDFRSTAGMRGIGWVILYHDTVADKLFNIWVNEHDVGHLAGEKPILVLDAFEHAFMTDYGLKKPDYVEAFMKGIDWK